MKNRLWYKSIQRRTLSHLELQNIPCAKPYKLANLVVLRLWSSDCLQFLYSPRGHTYTLFLFKHSLTWVIWWNCCLNLKSLCVQNRWIDFTVKMYVFSSFCFSLCFFTSPQRTRKWLMLNLNFFHSKNTMFVHVHYTNTQTSA